MFCLKKKKNQNKTNILFYTLKKWTSEKQKNIGGNSYHGDALFSKRMATAKHRLKERFYLCRLLLQDRILSAKTVK